MYLNFKLIPRKIALSLLQWLNLLVSLVCQFKLRDIISQQEMVKVINNYTLIQKIGEGNYGEVYRALNTKKMGQFAVKIIPIEKFQENNLLQQCTVNQVKTLSTIGSCEFIVKYEDHFQTRNNYYFVYEYCNGGTLMDALKKQGHYSEKKALTIFRQLLEAFKVLNRFNIMHRDIKPENIFFNNGKVKLGDFGFCKGLKPGQHMAKTMLGSPIYMAPQVLKGQNYTTKADIWSLGVVLYEMLFGVCPYQSKSIAMLISTINNNDIQLPLEINNISQKSQILLKKLLTKDYFRRISWIELFCFKIDQEGNYIESENTPKSPYNNSNKSFSIIKEEMENKATDKSNEAHKKPASLPKQQKMKFYSEKYMNAVMQPIHSGSKGTEKKISLFAQNLMDKFNIKDQGDEIKNNGSQRKIERQNLLNPIIQQSKRQKLLLKHQQCLYVLLESLKYLETKEIDSISDSFIALNKVQSKLKEITEEIKMTQTDLLDVASLINYQIIQIDRQIIDTKQELLRRKMEIPKLQRPTTVKSLDSTISTPPPQVKAFHMGAVEATVD